MTKHRKRADSVSLRQLEYLVSVAEAGKITVAATRLGVSQSTLSQQIAELERAVGTSLLVRQAGGVMPTPAGKVLVDQVKGVLSAVDHAVAAARSTAGIGEVRILVGTLLTISQQLLPPVVRALARTHEHVEIAVRSFRNYRLLTDAVLAGEVNVAVGPRPDAWTGRLRSLGWEEFVIVTAADDDSLPDPVPVRDLATRRWVHYDGADNGLGIILDSVCARAGFRPLVAIRGPHTDAAASYAAAGLAIALLPESSVPPGLPLRALRPSPAVRREITVYALDGPTATCPCGRELVDCVVQPIRKMPQR